MVRPDKAFVSNGSPIPRFIRIFFLPSKKRNEAGISISSCRSEEYLPHQRREGEGEEERIKLPEDASFYQFLTPPANLLSIIYLS